MRHRLAIPLVDDGLFWLAGAGVCAGVAAIVVFGGPVLAFAVALGLTTALCSVVAARHLVLVLLPIAGLVPPLVRLPSVALPDLTPLRAGVCLSAFALVIAWLRIGMPRRFKIDRPVIALGVTFTLYVLLLAMHTHVRGDMSRGIAYSIESFAYVGFVCHAVRSRGDVRLLVNVLIAFGLLAAGAALIEFSIQHYLFAAREPFFFHAAPRGGSIRCQGVFPHPIVLGVALALLSPVAVVRALGTRGVERMWAGSASIVMLAALVTTFSRGPWLGALVGLLVAGALLESRRRLWLASALVLALFAIAFSPFGGTVSKLAVGIVEPGSGQSTGGYTVDYRKQLFDQTIQYARTHPLGAGPGGSGTVSLYASVGGHATDLAASVDNAYAKYALELGPIGLGLFTAVLLLLLRASARSFRRWKDDSELRSILAALIGGQLGMLAMSSSVATFSWAQIAFVFWTLTGLALRLGPHDHLEKESNERPIAADGLDLSVRLATSS